MTYRPTTYSIPLDRDEHGFEGALVERLEALVFHVKALGGFGASGPGGEGCIEWAAKQTAERLERIESAVLVLQEPLVSIAESLCRIADSTGQE